MKIICLSGKAQHAKDTSASFLKETLEARGKKVLIAHYADVLKYICTAFFNWDGKKDEVGRSLLQYVGTERIRSKNENYFVSFIESILSMFPDEWDYVLIPDCRFPNEIDFLKTLDHDVVHLRIIRDTPGWVSPLTEEQQNHISETALDDVKPDFVILNCGTLNDLKDRVYELAGYLENGTHVVTV